MQTLTWTKHESTGRGTETKYVSECGRFTIYKMRHIGWDKCSVPYSLYQDDKWIRGYVKVAEAKAAAQQIADQQTGKPLIEIL